MNGIRTLRLCLLGLLLASCSNGPAEIKLRDYGQIGGASGTELAAEQVLHRSNGTEPQTLDPHRAEGVPASNILRDLFEPLVMEAPDGALIPGAAESWTISADGRTYTFRLRADGRWSNGDPVTADDWVFSLRRGVDPATLSIYSSILYPIKNAEAINKGELEPTTLGARALDSLTLELTLENPTPYFLGLLNHSMAYAVHPPTVREFGEQFAKAGQMVSNGAYRLRDWVVQSHVELERNTYFRDNASTTIDTVFFYALENVDAVFARYRADELDFTVDLPIRQLDYIRAAFPTEIYEEPYLATYYYGLNVTKPPFKDAPELRRALAMAVDREILTDKLLRTGVVPAYGWVPPVLGYTQQQPEWAAWTPEQRHAEARRLYAAAGYSADNPLVVELLYNTSQEHKRLAIAISAMWKQVLGAETRLLNQEWKVFLQNRALRATTQVYRSGWTGDYNDANTFAELMTSDNPQNGPGWSNPDYDALVDAAVLATDLEQRARLLEQAERLLLAEQPIIPLYFYVAHHLVKPWVGGFVPNVMDHTYTKDLYILAHE